MRRTDPLILKAMEEHDDFLRKIANEVYDLVRKPENMARFREQVSVAGRTTKDNYGFLWTHNG
ncbi:MAG: hypothetical protein ACYS8I_15280 [Planctomycetota bacterium]|jgi:hypothetical protein